MDSDPPTHDDAARSAAVPRPATASMARRVLGWMIDYALVMVPGTTLVVLALAALVQGLPGYVGAVAADVGWSGLMKLITHAGTGFGGIGTAASSEWISFALPLIVAILFVPLLQFGYQSVLLAWRGRTIGKMITDTSVVTTGSDTPRLKRRLALRRAFITTFLETGLLSVALVVIAIGGFAIGALVWGIAVVAFWINALTLLGPRRRTLVDRVSGTSVVRRGLYAQVAAQSSALARSAVDTTAAAGRRSSDVAAAAGRRTSEAAASAGRLASDAAAVAGQAARQGVEALTRTAPVQQALNSRAAKQAQVVGAAGADQARRLGEQAAGRARQLGGRAQQLWKEQRAKRKQPDGTGPDLMDNVPTDEGG